MADGPQCKTCRWWGERRLIHTGGPGAECKRHAPTRAPDGYPTYGGPAWPTTVEEDWCGDHEAAPHG